MSLQGSGECHSIPIHHNHKSSVLTKKKLSYVLKQNSCVDKVPSPIHFIYAVHHEKEE